MDILQQVLSEAIASGFEVVNVHGPNDRTDVAEMVVRYGYRAKPRREERVVKSTIPIGEFAALTSAVMQLIEIERSFQEAAETTLVAGPKGELAEFARQRQESVTGAFVFEGTPVAASYFVPRSGAMLWNFWLGFATNAALTEWFRQYAAIMTEFAMRNASGRPDQGEHDRRKNMLLCDAAKHVVLSEFDLDAWARANNIPLRSHADVEAENVAFAEARARENPVIETPRGGPVATAEDIYAGRIVRTSADDRLRIVTGISSAGVMVSESGRILDAVPVDPSTITHVVFPSAEYKPRPARSGRELIAPICDLALDVEFTWKDGRAIYDMIRALYDDHKFGPESR